MSGSGLYDSLQIAYEFIQRAEQLARGDEYEAAQAALEKAKSYAFNNEALLGDIQSRTDSLHESRWEYVKRLEREAADLFNQDQFDASRAREVLQTLLSQDSENQLAQNLWAELPTKEAAERERRVVDEFRDELEKIWQRAQELEDIGAGSRAVAEYERAVAEASKRAGDFPSVIPLQHLKLTAAEKRDRAKDKWVGTPTLILARKGQELVERYETLKHQGEIETEFFDENGEYLGRLPIGECIDRAKKLASRFAEQKAQDYLGQARELLAESPGAAYDKIQDALSLAYPSDFAKSILEQELKEKIQPAMQRREKAQAQLNAALSKEDPVEAWTILREVEQIDRFTPGLDDARQRLLPMLKQKFTTLMEAGHRFQELEDFETARSRFQTAIDIGHILFAYGDEFQDLHPQAQEDFERCVQAEREAEQFDHYLADIAQQGQAEPEQVKEQLAGLATQKLSPRAANKVERLRVQIDFKMGVDQLFDTLDQKMLVAKDATELLPILEGARQASLDYPDEQRFPRLIERISARRSFLQGVHLHKDPEQYAEARELLQQVVDLQGDDATTAQNLLDEITTDEKREADIAIAVQDATKALDSGDVRSAFLLLNPYRHAVSRQMNEVRQLISTAVTRWRNEIDQQLEELVAAGDLSLPKVELLIQGLKQSQSPRLAEWQLQALAPAYANTARDLEELNRWDQAGDLWEAAFRLAPGDLGIVEGRRNSRKHRALVRAQMAFDLAEKERLLHELNQLYADDPTIKRYLAEFYYDRERYAEARLAISQAMFLLEQLAVPASDTDVEAIRQVEVRIRETEEIEKRKLLIRSQITGNTNLGDLREARRTYEQLVEATPEQAEKLGLWWTGLIKETVKQIKTQVAKLSDAPGTIWTRAELLCKILALQADPQIQEQVERLLRLIYSQLPVEVKSVVDNPEGIGYGSATQALANHVVKAKYLYRRLMNMGQIERVIPDLGIDVGERTLDLNEVLYELELTLERLYFAQERQREIKGQIVVAMMTGRWEAIEDSLRELEMKGLSQHRGLQELTEEIERAKQKRAGLETVVEQIKQAMVKESFKAVQDRLEYMVAEDPADETQLQSTLEVVDPYTGLKIKGHRALETSIAEKMAVVDKLVQWRAGSRPLVDWSKARSRMIELADNGDFASASDLGRAVTGLNDIHQEMLFHEEDTWSLGHVRQYLEEIPVTREQLNSARAQTFFDEADQKLQVALKQISECEAMVEELWQKEKDFAQIVDNLRSSLEKLNRSRNFLDSLLAPSEEIQNVKLKIMELIEQGRQLCPTYPLFTNFEKSNLLGR